MPRISHSSLVQAIATVRAMDTDQKTQLADELFRTQPHMFATFLVQKRFGASLAKMDFLLDILFICFQAMKESGLAWPLVTEDELDRQMKKNVVHLDVRDDRPGLILAERYLQKHIEEHAEHPEPELLAYVQGETANWLARIVPEDCDKYIAMAAATFVNCIAFVPIPLAKATPG